MRKHLSIFVLAILLACQPIPSILNDSTVYAASERTADCKAQLNEKKCPSVSEDSGQMTDEDLPKKQVSGVSGSKDTLVQKKKLAAIIQSKQLWIKQKRVSEAVK